MSQFRKLCPLLLESDSLSLSGNFLYTTTARTAHVIDEAVGATHTLLRPAIINALHAGPRYDELAAQVSSKGVKPEELVETLGFMNHIGSLRIRRTPINHIKSAVLRCKHFLLGVTYPPHTWRQPFSVLALHTGIVRASWLVLLLLPLSFSLFAFSGLVQASDSLAMGGFFVAGFWASMMVHELAHSAIIMKHGQRPVILQAGMRIGLIHKPLPSVAEAQSALAGPFAGMLSIAVLGIIGTSLYNESLALVTVIIASLHLASFLPAYGDGATLAAVLREARNKRA